MEKTSSSCKYVSLAIITPHCADGDVQPAECMPKKKSKWHKWAEEKPTGKRKLIVVATYNGKYTMFVDIDQKTAAGWDARRIDVAVWKYMPKPPKEYR